MNQLLQRYLELLLETNAYTNLTAIREPGAIKIRHFEDSLALLGAAGFQNSSLLDVGSGAGFPGLVLRIAEPTIALTLLEPNGKKAAFLHHLCDELGFSDVNILQERGEVLGQDVRYREQFDLVTARGVTHMEALCELCLPFLRVGGLFLAMKEREEACSILEQLGGQKESSHAYTLSDGREHLALRIRKQQETPKQYPRPWARIKRSLERLQIV